MTLRLPTFELARPTTLAEAAALLTDPSTTLLGGGTDLLPKMKRRQVSPTTLVSLAGIEGFRGARTDDDGRCIVGAGTTLAELAASRDVPPVLASTARTIASPQVRSTATVGGNLCLDTRCNYIDMPELWRAANGHCLKDGGDTCWVAPRSDHCWAINSSDLAPVAVAMGASVRLVGAESERTVALEGLYQNDGINHLTKRTGEILAELVVPAFEGQATYVKLRRRGSIDFALVGVAAAGRFDEADTCVDVRLIIGAVASAPVRAADAEECLVGRRFTDDVIEEAARIASGPIRPQDNTDTGSRYRKWMIPVYVRRALRQIRPG